MHWGIGSQDTVDIVVAADSGTGRVIIVMTGSAVLRVFAGKTAVVALPTESGMSEWQAYILFVTIITELPGGMASRAIG